jgi:hypothetical protein
MNQLTICRRLSLIHAVKCNKATSFDIARQSSDELQNFFNRLASVSDGGAEVSSTEVQTWMNNTPIVTEQDINELLKR